MLYNRLYNIYFQILLFSISDSTYGIQINFIILFELKLLSLIFVVNNNKIIAFIKVIHAKWFESKLLSLIFVVNNNKIAAFIKVIHAKWFESKLLSLIFVVNNNNNNNNNNYNNKIIAFIKIIHAKWFVFFIFCSYLISFITFRTIGMCSFHSLTLFK
jgi:hypothetical protein